MKKKEKNLKKEIINKFSSHVSSGKVKFYKKYGMKFVMGEREGSFIYDLDGKKKLLNLHCNGGVFNLGHRNRELIELLKNSFEYYDIGNHHLISKPRAELAEYLSSLMPKDLDYVIFGVSGGEAIDTAIKVARAYTGRRKIVSAKGGYHGHTGLALAAGDPKYREPFYSSSSDFVQVKFNNIDAMEEVVDRRTAAVILETVPATLGMPIADKDYFRKVKNLCERKGALLILDEVQSGLGRTGKLWAFEHFNVVPDIVVLGKGLSGGLYPITATVIRKELERIFRKDPFIHISTFGGAEPGAIVAKRVLEIVSESSFLKSVNAKSELFSLYFSELKRIYPEFVKGYRRLGLMMGLELRDEYSGPALTKSSYDNGLLIVYANNDKSVVQILPPLTISEDEIRLSFELLKKSLKKAKFLRYLIKFI